MDTFVLRLEMQVLRGLSFSLIHALGLSFPDTFVPLNLVHCFLLPLLLIFSPYV